MIGMLASSKAGHDKNKIYVIIKEDDEYVWLSDGNLRGMERPKKKRKKHIQCIKYFVDANLRECLMAGEPVMDSEIKRVIKAYKKQQSNT